MPSFDPKAPGRPWKARIKYNYKERFLGRYPTYLEALLVEEEKRTELTGVPYPLIGGPLRA